MIRLLDVYKLGIENVRFLRLHNGIQKWNPVLYPYDKLLMVKENVKGLNDGVLC